MCGIVGYIGDKQAQPVLLDCLSLLEYRGYDSCGIAVSSRSIEVYKDAIRVAALKKAAPKLSGKIGIGHTRWATHGAPSQLNAHPHLDCTGRIAVVHNGIINNYQQLREQLIGEGHSFTSETDTEVIPHLIEKHYQGDIIKAVEAALAEIDGSYAIIVMVAGEPRLVAARKDSPMVIGIGDREKFIASDVPAILNFTNRVIYLEDGDIGVITADSVKVKQHQAEVTRTENKISWTIEDAQKSGYEHFMLKEIHEQPRVIRDTLAGWMSAPEPILDLEAVRDNGAEAMLMLACGTSYHAALVGKYIVQELLKIPVRAELASEFNYYGQALAGTMAIVLTQSGETADTLRAMKRLKEAGCRVVAITNVVGSTASRIADQTIYTRAGPEISVAATKSFIAQLMALYWIMLSYAKIDASRLSSLTAELRQLPSKVQEVLDNQDRIAECAKYLAGFKDVFFMGRGINYPVALEGALKLKEISYLHAEGYAAGELKHGPFALLGSKTPVVAIVAQDNTHEPIVTSIKEIKARHSPVLAVVPEGDDSVEELADSVIVVPQVEPLFSPVVNTVALQLLAYYTALQRGCPIDFPRNLAKSVTVE
ncbi:MAG: glutamine--fructose-6-phosphate transaminase (isomerizing) [Chloroflexota bacterium]|nr:glutamine--fructose-6-phosphate transaminase (isomerizing) [Chloroflexota bacterium]